MLIFTALVRFDEGTNVRVVAGGRRFSPDLQFDLPNVENIRFGFTIMEPNEMIASGMEGICRFRMGEAPGLEILAKEITTGVKFKLSQGPIQLGTGVVDAVEQHSVGSLD
jgi:hypothetical protein